MPADKTQFQQAEYTMGYSEHETRRLQLQAKIYQPHSQHLLSLAGIGPGMRVIDIGCGAGDVSILAARLVGPSGTVLGVDSDPAILAVARQRAASAHLDNVSFQHAELPDVVLEQPVDALIGRLILMHLPDRTAAVRTLSRLVRPGGIVTFQEFNASRTRTVPYCPVVMQGGGWVIQAFARAGVPSDLGESLPSLLREAGLRVSGTAVEIPSGGTDSDAFRHLTATVGSLSPLMEKLGVATREEIDIDTLADRMTAEADALGAWLYLPELVGAWAITPLSVRKPARLHHSRDRSVRA